MRKVNSSRPVIRETSAVCGRRPVVVCLDDPDKLTMWVKGSRKRYKVPFLSVYTLAVQASVDAKKKVNRGFGF